MLAISPDGRRFLDSLRSLEMTRGGYGHARGAFGADNAPLAGLPLVATAGCGHGSRRWDDDRENGLKCSHGYKVGDDDSGWGAAEGGREVGGRGPTETLH